MGATWALMSGREIDEHDTGGIHSAEKKDRMNRLSTF